MKDLIIESGSYADAASIQDLLLFIDAGAEHVVKLPGDPVDHLSSSELQRTDSETRDIGELSPNLSGNGIRVRISESWQDSRYALTIQRLATAASDWSGSLSTICICLVTSCFKGFDDGGSDNGD
jgi:hypothetical protein